MHFLFGLLSGLRAGCGVFCKQMRLGWWRGF
jgi:hypothetical protein